MFTPISLESFLAALPAISALVLLGNMDNHSHVLPGRSRREDIRKIGQCEKCSIFLPRVITLSSVKIACQPTGNILLGVVCLKKAGIQIGGIT